jgi:hypothetical protein
MVRWRRNAGGRTAERAKHGVDASPGPDAFTRAMVAAADPNRQEEAAELADQARREAARTGTEDLVDAALATIGAHAAAGPQAADDPWDDAIRAAVTGAWITDQTVYVAVYSALAPAEPGRLGEKRARQAAVLLRLGRQVESAAAAKAAVAELSGQSQADDGCRAYAAWMAAEAALVEGDEETAYRLATTAAEAFRRGNPLPPVCMLDLVQALALRAEAARRTGREREARFARSRAVDLFRTTPIPAPPAGSMPAGWGLPVVDPRRWARLRAWVDAPW